MKIIDAILVAVLLSSQAHATPYARLMDPAHVHQSAAVLIDPNGAQPTVAVMDVCTVTHSTADGSIIPMAWRSIIPPENLCLLGIGGGGSAGWRGGRLRGSAVVDINTSVNIAPQIGALMFAGINNTSPVLFQAVKAAMLNTNGNGVRIGGGLAGNAIKDGVFQSVKEALPGRGVLDIFKQASRVNVGYSWVW